MCTIDWTALGTWVGAAATLTLAIAAIWAGLIAKEQVEFWDAIERRKASFALIRDYTTPIYFKDSSTGPDVISPMQAYANLLNRLPNDPIAPPVLPKDPTKMRSILWEVMGNYYVLINYLDEVKDLYDRQILDRDLFLSRQGRVLITAAVALHRVSDLVMASDEDMDLMSRVEKIARDFEAKRQRRPSP
jgi:hypothetical protein